MQTQVGINDSDERHIGKVQSLGNHLRADEDVDLARAKITEDAPEIVLFLEGIGVHAGDARMGEEFRKRVFHFFGPKAGITNGGVATIGCRASAWCLA